MTNSKSAQHILAVFGVIVVLLAFASMPRIGKMIAFAEGEGDVSAQESVVPPPPPPPPADENSPQTPGVDQTAPGDDSPAGGGTSAEPESVPGSENGVEGDGTTGTPGGPGDEPIGTTPGDGGAGGAGDTGGAGGAENQPGTPAAEGPNTEDGAPGEPPGEGSTQPGASEIETGNATAVADVVNVVNTNIVDSEGLFAILNLFQPFLGSLDIREFSFGAAPCCDPSDTSVNAVNDAAIENTVSTVGDTGSNSVEMSDATVSRISTGSSGAVANVVNVVNTNIVDSKYLLLVMNNFSDFLGDIVFPGADFFSGLATQVAEGPADVPESVTIGNTATVDNNLEVGAETGDNAAQGGEGSSIQTGDAQAAANAVTMANTNVIGGDSVFILIRFFGKWSGQLFSPPPGLLWQETPGGIVLYDQGNQALVGSETNPDGADVGCCTGGTEEVSTQNSATIQNNVKVFALTGANKVSGAGASQITTGNAVAAANVVNVANTNVVGRNWILAIINIFGDWGGNLSFGRPDLWVAERAEAPNPLRPGNEVTYVVDIINKGDADATDVILESVFDPYGRVDITDSAGGEPTERGMRWRLPRVAARETAQVRYGGRAGGSLPFGTHHFVTTASATSYEPDADPLNNTDAITLTTERPYPGGRQVIAPAVFGYGTGAGSLPELSIAKTHNARGKTVKPGETVSYRIAIKNSGVGSVFNAKATDILYDPLGFPINTHSWKLDTVLPGEKIIIDYDMKFNGNAPYSGVYVNQVRVAGVDFFRDPVSVAAWNSVHFESPDRPKAPEPPQGEVMGVAASCDLYLSSHLRYGGRNNPEEVRKLQRFLNLYEGTNLPTTGYYGRLTYNAVRAFQLKYAMEVLAPWASRGLRAGEATGHVYQTTKRWINMRVCPSLELPMPAV